MAKKKKGRKKKTTYDSKEAKAFYGLIALFIGVLTLLSYFLEGPVFVFLKNLTAGATIFLALFCFNLSLYLFKSKFPLAQGKSLIGQFIFVLFYSAFINSIFGGGYSLNEGEEAQYGGIIGFYIYTFFSENVFLNFTPVFLFAVILVSLPIALSMTLVQFLDALGRFFQWIFSFFKRKEGDAEQSNSDLVDVPVIGPATFGDFRKQSEQQQPKPEPVKQVEIKADPQTVSDVSANKISQPKVAIKEESVEGAFVNEELQYPSWKLPSVNLLNPYKKQAPPKENISKNADIIEQTLQSFGVKAKVVDVLIGPTVTQYALDIALGTKVSKIANLSNDLALALATASNSLRIEAPIPGTSYVGIEIPNEVRSTVHSKEVMEQVIKSDRELPMGLGKNINGEVMNFNLQKMPHILIAGATGSGKSVLTNSFIVSLLMTKTPDEVKFIMVDPKQVELSDYNGIPHLLTPVITEMDKVLNALKWAVAEMENRYTIFKEAKVRNIEAYNDKRGFSALPYIVIVIDEMADMMMSTNKVETESVIVRLAQKARATGIHLVLATQRPSVDVITGLIKANIPARVGMSVTTQIDSRVIMDTIGAEALLGNGDLLFKDPSHGRPSRIQGMWMAPDEIQRIVKFIKEQVPEVHYTKEVVEKQADPNEDGGDFGELSSDNQFENAVRIVVNSQKGSASLLQRKLSIGYNRAARLLDELEEHGVVGPPNGSKPRDVLLSDADTFLASAAGDSQEG
ncbi:DNA translocase FtsK [Candidatus Dojkabacteria bacterium]|uniref:DNA translocase FtsK n=1 Tax=Candidatus Dojkabacteria bacterium TaxID=2099670 RepID=A0A955L532_9BACT|nr:DNA translocase FtsK [Candidatus Dojkabacteria bacterium]